MAIYRGGYMAIYIRGGNTVACYSDYCIMNWAY